jgi:hypothetical protein
MSENGFLTDRDKQFLRGEKEYSGKNARQMRYQVRQTIRERTRAAFRDFSLLYATLDESERKKIFNVTDSPLSTEGGLSRETRDGIIDMFAFLYLSLMGEVGEEFGRRMQVGIPEFESILEKAISKAEQDRRPEHNGVGPFVSTDLTVDVKEEVDIAAAAEKYARGDVYSLSEAELRALAQSAWDETNDFALAPMVQEKREDLGIDTDFKKQSEWWTETFVENNE